MPQRYSQCYTGVRFGTAELYGVLDTIPEIEDYLAVGQSRPSDPDEQVLMFIKMKSGRFDAAFQQRIRTSIRKALSPRHVPAYVLQVKDIPYTMNGKRIENVVREIVNGRSPKLSGTVANPECLVEYVQFSNLNWAAQPAKL